ncbi:cobalamin biosynthesis bifunctional protein CbiET [[Phormidium ambiguum] IAM M-71]|uniref:tRNA (guanine(46)-N(7))-methyltransferase n=1 Tax=[Phormidium ambiguum] IAM M-71 TaxID=454136 RepID=A0A1U7I5Y5_9CYAN|nr:precorrin-6y C5,15-methyltransferase (decarboxylating) subunit CbiE [Phormidium ambiguum]OKH31718.1 cobalamin biosynthesis bifunctional protein CbiET [Phormidium ambiguum IAM M-71]
MTVHVVGIGLDGASGLREEVRQIIAQATVLVGSDRHLNYFPEYCGDRIILKDIKATMRAIRDRLETDLVIVVLVTGDPLFFGLGRLLLAELPKEKLTFHPHLSAIQLAFNRIKIPWQDAKVVSVHGRCWDQLTQTLQQGAEKIAILTDDHHNPAAIARLLQSLDLANTYQLWICENLGGLDERVGCWPLAAISTQRFAPLNVVVLLRQTEASQEETNFANLPLLGLPDSSFLSYSDRPGLITKREIRLLVLGELALKPGQIIWDIGAGTGSVAIEIARLFPSSTVYAIEKTAAGISLIEQNCQRFGISNVVSIHGTAPEILHHLPSPDRIFIGGSGGNLKEILRFAGAQLHPQGVLVLALATLEHLTLATQWVGDKGWEHHLLQAQLMRSVAVGSLTRFSPLNPVTILSIKKRSLG